MSLTDDLLGSRDDVAVLVDVDVAADEVEQRRTLRDQITRLDHAVAQHEARCPSDVPSARGTRVDAPRPRVLDLGELEEVRDRLSARLVDLRVRETERAVRVLRARALRDAMLADPAAHRDVGPLTSTDVGESGCRRWSVRPVLGPLGRFAGWWRVKISSGCPRRSAPRRSLARRVNDRSR